MRMRLQEGGGGSHLALLKRIDRMARRARNDLIRDSNGVVPKGEVSGGCFLCEGHCGRWLARLRTMKKGKRSSNVNVQLS